jgi:hypothetical protein
LITPLRKYNSDGKLYYRRPVIEAKILKLAQISSDDLVARCEIRQKDDPDYVPSECLVYFIRASRGDRPNASFNKLYKLLVERILHGLPIAERLNDDTTSTCKETIREKVFECFVEMLAHDRTVYQDKLDYFEINFAHALKRMRQTVQVQVWRHENRSTALHDEETGELSVEVERALGTLDSNSSPAFVDDDYRSRLYAAINTLPVKQRRVLEMMLEDIPIDSKDPNAITIRKVLNVKSEKTIRNQRDKAYDTLRNVLNKEDYL